MTKLKVFHTIWFWSSLGCKVILNKGFLWSGCCVCEHTHNLVVFVNTHSIMLCSILSLLFVFSLCTWFLQWYVIFFFCCHAFPITFALHTFLNSVFLIKRNIDYK